MRAMRKATSTIAALMLLLPLAAQGQESGNYPFVYITDETGTILQGPERTNVIPLWPVRSCFGWSVAVPGPDRIVDLVEVQQLSGKTRFDAGPGIIVNANSDTTTRHVKQATIDGRLDGTWCINDADPPGMYKYMIHIDGKLRAEFTYCAIRFPAGQEIDLKSLSCKNNFESS
jgi:hypothetical protein